MEEAYKLITERSFLRNPASNITVKGTVIGNLDTQKLINAVKELHCIHPIMSSTIRMSAGDSFYFVPDDNAIPQVTFVKMCSDTMWLDIVKQEEMKPFYLTGGLLYKIIVLEGIESFDIVLISHHVMADGLSAVYLFCDLLKLYAGVKRHRSKGQIKTIQCKEDYSRKYGVNFITKLVIKVMNHQWLKAGRVFTEEEYKILYKGFIEKNQSDYKLHTLNEKEFLVLKENTKYYGVSINTALITAFLGAMKHLAYSPLGSKDKVTIAINIRDNLTFDARKTIGNYVSGIDIYAAYDTGKDYWDNVFYIQDLISKKLSNPKEYMKMSKLFLYMEGGIFDALFFASQGLYQNKNITLAKKLIKKESNERCFNISNLGNLDIKEKYGDVILKKVAYLPPTTLNYNQTIGAITVNNQLCISLCYRKENIAANYMDELLKYMIKFLTE